METNRFDHNDAATILASGLIYALQTKPPSLLEFDGTHVKTLIANLGGRPDGVQVDATRGLIYFSMMGKPRLLDAREDFSAADGSIECCILTDLTAGYWLGMAILSQQSRWCSMPRAVCSTGVIVKACG
jgi:hypothetical protein